MKRRGIFKDIHINGLGSQNIDSYLGKKSRTIFSILELEDNRLPVSSLSTIFPLFIAQKLGHNPVLILDDRKAQDDNSTSTTIEQSINDAVRVCTNQVEHFLMQQYHKSSRHLYDFHQIKILKISDIIPEELYQPTLKSFLSSNSEFRLEMLDNSKSVYENYKSIRQAEDIRNAFKNELSDGLTSTYFLNSSREINDILGSSTQISNEYDEISLDILEAMEVPHKVIEVKHVDIPKSNQVRWLVNMFFNLIKLTF